MNKNIFKLISGLFLVSVGGLYILYNLGIISQNLNSIISDYWPTLIIAIAIYKIFEILFSTKQIKEKAKGIYWSFAFIFIAAVLINDKINFIGFKNASLWSLILPIFLIYIGLSIIFKKDSFIVDGKTDHNCYYTYAKTINEDGQNINKNDSTNQNYSENSESENSEKDGTNDSNDESKSKNNSNSKKRQPVNQSHFIGEMKIGDQPWALTDSNYTLNVGETNIDLTTAIIEEGVTNLNINGAIGEINLIIPFDLAVNINGSVSVGDANIVGPKAQNASQSVRKTGITSNALNYKSENYEEAIKKVNINISINVGEISIRIV